MKTAHIVVVGAGPVGLAAALALARLPGVAVTLVAQHKIAAPTLAEVDHRVYALAPASIKFLASLGAVIDLTRAGPVRAMAVFGDRAENNETALNFNTGAPLAHIVEHSNLLVALVKAVVNTPQIVLRENAPIADVTTREGRHTLSFADGKPLTCTLLIAADGGHSPLRERMQIESQIVDYASAGVVANFKLAQSHHDTARQWFARDGVLALLPLPNNVVSMVWSVANARAAELVSLSPAALCAAVACATHLQADEFELVSAVTSFPLKRQLARDWVLPGFALVGDAAHTIHPLAGQGLNLGLADVRVLAESLAARGTLSDVGDVALLRRYARARAEPAWAMGSATGGLRALFASEDAALTWARNRGLALLEKSPTLKTLFTDYASTA